MPFGLVETKIQHWSSNKSTILICQVQYKVPPSICWTIMHKNLRPSGDTISLPVTIPILLVTNGIRNLIARKIPFSYYSNFTQLIGLLLFHCVPLSLKLGLSYSSINCPQMLHLYVFSEFMLLTHKLFLIIVCSKSYSTQGPYLSWSRICIPLKCYFI